MSTEKEKAYNAGLDAALQAGNDILKKGGTALDAVEAAVRVLEDNPLFNAGKGAVFKNGSGPSMNNEHILITQFGVGLPKNFVKKQKGQNEEPEH